MVFPAASLAVIVMVKGVPAVVEVGAVMAKWSRAPKVMVNVLDAELPVLSVAVTVCEPGVDVGALKVQVKVPEVAVVTGEGVVACVVLSYWMVTVFEGVKPVPVTVIVVAAGPVVGVSVIWGGELNVAVTVPALLIVAFVDVAVGLLMFAQLDVVVQPANCEPLVGVAVIVSCWPMV